MAFGAFEALRAAWQTWLWAMLVFVGSVALATAIHRVTFATIERWTKRTGHVVGIVLTRRGRAPTRLLFPLLAISLVLPALPLSSPLTDLVRQLLGLAMLASVGWLLIGVTDGVDDLVSSRFNLTATDNLRARRIQTQVRVLRRVAHVVIGVITISLMLTSFPSIRELGISLFASAGLAGLVVGMAARPTLASLIAGLQIALTEPIRIEDVVIVEGEWGWIEEIHSTYVVVRVWDLRRLVVPLSYFIEHPFQNWTRNSADLLGTVYIYTDFTVPVDAVRQELFRVLQASPLWDRRAWGLQVTNASEHTMELRALMSASDSGKAWDLRCAVREQLIGFLQQHYPHSLPRSRAELTTSANGANPIASHRSPEQGAG